MKSTHKKQNTSQNFFFFFFLVVSVSAMYINAYVRSCSKYIFYERVW